MPTLFRVGIFLGMRPPPRSRQTCGALSACLWKTVRNLPPLLAWCGKPVASLRCHASPAPPFRLVFHSSCNHLKSIGFRVFTRGHFGCLRAQPCLPALGSYLRSMVVAALKLPPFRCFVGSAICSRSRRIKPVGREQAQSNDFPRGMSITQTR